MTITKLIENRGFLGRGWKFPPTFTKGYYSAELSQFEQDVRESLNILISTLVGERVMRPGYGTNVHNLIFENLDSNTGTLIADELKKAILLHEPRIFVDKITPTQEELNGTLEMLIEYTIIATNTRYNIVYPFYFTEGTNL
jgi:phage baseplate assembly protein W